LGSNPVILDINDTEYLLPYCCFLARFALLHNPEEKNTESAGQDVCSFGMHKRLTKEEEKKRS